MTIFPTPFFARNSLYKGPINYVALQRRVTEVNGEYTTDMMYSVSGDGDEYHRSNVGGDLAAYRRGGPGETGAVFVQRVRRVGNYLFMCVRLVDQGTNVSINTRAFLFRTPLSDGKKWELVPTGIEGDVGGARWMVDIAGNDSYVVALASSGHIAVSLNGGLTFSPFGPIGFTGTNPATGLAASSAGFVAVGNGGQLQTAVDPRGAWTVRTSQFGSSDIYAALAGSVFVLAGAGGKISTAPLNNLVTWTARSTPITTDLRELFYGGGRWFTDGSNVNILTSTDGVAFAKVTNLPWGSGAGTLHTALWDGNEWRAYSSNSRISKGNGVTWTQLPDADGPGPFTVLAAYLD